VLLHGISNHQATSTAPRLTVRTVFVEAARYYRPGSLRGEPSRRISHERGSDVEYDHRRDIRQHLLNIVKSTRTGPRTEMVLSDSFAVPNQHHTIWKQTKKSCRPRFPLPTWQPCKSVNMQRMNGQDGRKSCTPPSGDIIDLTPPAFR